jgi:hypothetical protein
MGYLDYYNIGYHDGFLDKPLRRLVNEGLVRGTGHIERYTFGREDGAAARASDWRYINHDYAVSLSEDDIEPYVKN